jgi:hypothetical protein
MSVQSVPVANRSTAVERVISRSAAASVIVRASSGRSPTNPEAHSLTQAAEAINVTARVKSQ